MTNLQNLKNQLNGTINLYIVCKQDQDVAGMEKYKNLINKLEAEIKALETTVEVQEVPTTLYMLSVRNKETNEIKVVEYEARNIKEAKKDWRDNGYTVRFMATNQDDFDTECEKFYAKVDNQVSMRKIMKEVRAKY